MTTRYASVVRIFTTRQRPDHDNPWQSRRPSNSTGSGVVIGPGRVLTGAHVVADGTFVQVQKVSDPKKYVATVVASCHDADLALLEVVDPAFMNDIEPESFGELPTLGDRVSVAGYPIGGNEISITEGIVSRIEVQRYRHSDRMLLAVTVDAAINNGNSGGPVFQAGRVVGIAFQALQNAENIGEMVPVTLIERFLAEAARTATVRIPESGLWTQQLENPALRARLGLRGDQSGVRVCGVEYGGSAWGQVALDDVVLRVDGVPVADNGTVSFRGRHRTAMSVLFERFHVGETVAVEVLRRGEPLTCELTMKPCVDLVPKSQYDQEPRFVVFGGLVFQELTLDFLRTWNTWWDNAPSEFLQWHYQGIRTEERQAIVIVSQVLADEVNVGFKGLNDQSVVTINGQVPRSLAHLVACIDEATDLVEIDLSKRARIVFDVAQTRTADARIKERYRLPRLRSLH
jgi:S1-C subfamily serine protease